VLTTLRFGIIGRGSLSPKPSSRPLPGSVVTLDLGTRNVTQALEKVRWTLCAGRGYTLLPTAAHCCPLLPTAAHCCPLLPTAAFVELCMDPPHTLTRTLNPAPWLPPPCRCRWAS
jgi:hypothetical protein